MNSLINFVLDNSPSCWLGALGAIVWANVDMTTYERSRVAAFLVPTTTAWCFVFALAAKEVFEATLSVRALSRLGRARPHLSSAAFVGGDAFPPGGNLCALASVFGPAIFGSRLAIPCATDNLLSLP